MAQVVNPRLRAEAVLDGINDLHHFRGRMSKVTVDDVMLLLALVDGALAGACHAPGTDANGFARSCLLPPAHDGPHEATDSAGTPTGAATWQWDSGQPVAARLEDAQPR